MNKINKITISVEVYVAHAQASPGKRLPDVHHGINFVLEAALRYVHGNCLPYGAEEKKLYDTLCYSTHVTHET